MSSGNLSSLWIVDDWKKFGEVPNSLKFKEDHQSEMIPKFCE